MLQTVLRVCFYEVYKLRMTSIDKYKTIPKELLYMFIHVQYTYS